MPDASTFITSVSLLQETEPHGIKQLQFPIFKQRSEAWKNEPTLEAFSDATLAWVIRNLSGLSISGLPLDETKGSEYLGQIRCGDGDFHIVKVPRKVTTKSTKKRK